ncbi:MAG: protein kinase [Acidobacteriota bacterium]
MNCPHCSAPNPEGAASCAQCGLSSDSDQTISGEQAVAASMSGMNQTMDSPRSFVEWAKASASYGPMSLALPEGLEIGKRYRVVRLLGRGGMGAVYKVHDSDLDRDVALKLIRADIAEDAETLARFKREIQLSSTVTHRNVLRVYDLGESDGIKFLTMQLVSGDDLGNLIKAGPLAIDRVVRIFRQVCDGLRAAHEQGVIHRDLKPQNVMLGAGDAVYLTDFGLAKSLEQSGMTQTGAVLGTPFYMSPEQVQGQETDRRSDIYSLGVILYQMLTGTLPFTGRTPYEVMAQRVQKAARPAAELNPQIPPYLSKILARCMERDKTLRYQTVDEVLSDLDAETFRPTLRYKTLHRRWVPAATAGLAAAALLSALGWWAWNRRPATSARSPSAGTESVLITDFENRTGEPIFDGTLESSFGIALEGASFVTTYNRGQARRVAAQLRPGSTKLDEALGRLVAVREGVHVVTAGAIEKRGEGYRISVRAIDVATGKPIAKGEADASSKETVLASVARLAADVRGGLGDTTPKSLQIAAAETFTAGSLEASHEYAQAQDAQYAGKYDDAVRFYQKALDLDPELGRADAGLAVVYSNQGLKEPAEKFYKQALARIDRMSDREKYRTRGGYYLIVRRDPDKAIEEYGELVKRYPADTAGISNLALAWFYKRDMGKALAEGRRAIAIYPKNVPQRNNVGLYAMYAGDFDSAVREQRAVLELNPKFVLASVGLALSQLGQGHPDQAAETWKKAAAINARGASAAALGLADLALYEGRTADAIGILEAGAKADIEGKDTESAAVKLAALAGARLSAGDKSAALEAADRAAGLNRSEVVLFPVARVYLAAGKEPKAIAIADELGKRLEQDPQAYGQLIRGEAELARGNAREAVKAFVAAKALADTWMGRFDLGRAYLALEAFPEADAELEVAAKRRGEATALFLDESPTYRLFPPALYALGRAQEGIRSPASAETYKAFLAMRVKGEQDPLVADARRRAGAK